MQPLYQPLKQFAPVASRCRGWLTKLAVGLIVTVSLGIAGDLKGETIVSRSAGKAELLIHSSPPPIRREGRVYIPVKILQSELGAQVTMLESNRTLVRFYGRSLLLTPGSPQVEINRTPRNLSAATFLYENTLYVPVQILEDLWGFKVELSQEDAVRIVCDSSCITGLRYSVAPDRVRIVFDLDRPAPFSFETRGAQYKIVFRTAVKGNCRQTSATASAPLPQSLQLQDILVKDVQLHRPEGLEATAQIGLRYRVPVQTFTLDDPPRIVVDCVKVFEEINTTTLDTGAELSALWLGTPAGPVKAHAVKIALHGPEGGYEVRPLLARTNLLGLASLGEMAKRASALVAVNGGYFAGNGSPLGDLVIDGEWIKTGRVTRTGLIVTHSGKVIIDTIRWRGQVTFGTGTHVAISALNARNGDTGNAVVLTPRWGDSVRLLPHEVGIAVTRGKVVTIKKGPDQGSLEVPLPNDGFVVCVRNSAAAQVSSVQPGTDCSLEWSLGKDYEDVQHVLSAGPRLVKKGAEHITAADENFKADVAYGRAPRTAVGVTADNHVILLAAEGRHRSESIGMTLQEAARWMIKLGAIDAMNLDGGSSTTMVVGGKVITASAGEAGKPVSDALVIVPN